jgi:hypothetical protein
VFSVVNISVKFAYLAEAVLFGVVCFDFSTGSSFTLRQGSAQVMVSDIYEDKRFMLS